ncbi:tetratricopeptide repeat protein 28 [Nematostella vectensis]|uniref:tetratricopeptide repeat protein 28 n=1 Tax=Nematostella vectensis TaxID=45351 RepID=UPI0020773680|nr:tetratricopeptide repeat protein 28 [Nematostella vectensis]
MASDDENDPKQFRFVVQTEEEVKTQIGELKDLLYDACDAEDKIQEAGLLSYLGIAYFKISDFQRSLVYQEKYLALCTELEDSKGIGRAYCNLGCVNKAMGDFTLAKENFEKAIKISQENGNKRAIARVYNNLANIYEMDEDFQAALECHQKRLAISHELKDTNAIGKACASLGNIYHVMGDLPASIRFYQEMLKILREKLRIQDTLAEESEESGDDDMVDLDLVTLEVMEEVKRNMKKEEEQRRLAEEGGARPKRLNLRGVVKGFKNIKRGKDKKTEGGDQDKKKDKDKKNKSDKEKKKKTYTIHTNPGMQKCVFPYKENDPNQFRLVEEPADELLDKIKRLRKIQRELENSKDEEELADKANLQGTLGILHFKLGHYETSQYHYQQQLDFAKELCDRKTQSCAYNNLGCLHKITGRLDEAFDCFQRALQLAKDRGDRRSIAKTLNNLGNVFELKCDVREAIDCHEERLDLAREMGDLDGVSKACGSLGGLYNANGDLFNSIARYQELVDTLRTKLKIQVMLADDEESSDDEVDLDEIAYEIQRERLEALEHYKEKTTKKTTLSERFKQCGDNVTYFFKSIVKR